MSSLRLLGAAVLGALATLAFPPYNWVALYPLALAGLLGLSSDQTRRRAAVLGWVFGFAHFVSGLYWIFISTSRYGGAPPWLGVLLVIALSFYLALYPALACLLTAWARRAAVPTALLFWPAAWVLAELARGWIGTGFPWLSGGYVLLDTPLAPLAPLAGVHGLSICAALAAGGLWLLIQKGRTRLGALAAAGALAVLVFALPPALNWTTASAPPLSVGLAQGNIPQDLKWQAQALTPIKAHYLDLSERLADSQLIVWPEVAIPAPVEDEPEFYDALRQWAIERDLVVLVGALRYDDPIVLNTVRAFGAGQDPASPGYIKRHLVPFGEYFPMPAALKDFMWQLDMRYSDFSPGPDEQPLLRVAGVPLGLSICFEDAFGREIIRALPEAQLLVTVTNDGWFADSSAPAQHLQIARMRALEAGRELIRVSNRGVSARIAADGEVLEALEFMQSGALKVEAQPRSGSTPYARFGDWPVLLLVLLVLIPLSVHAWRSRRAASIR